MNRLNRSTPPRRGQSGLSLVELLVAVALGLMVMAGLAALFASSSASRNELERSARQIENGRFAMELITNDLRLAGFYGEAQVSSVIVPGTMPDPCSNAAADWVASMTVSIQHYNDGIGVPPCILGDRKIGTDVVVIRRVATCEAGVGTCENSIAGLPYIQVAKCKDETPTRPFVLNTKGGPTPFNLTERDCGTVAGMRQYLIRAYFISIHNGNGDSTPTLMRVDFNGNTFTRPEPLVEGIEELNIEYGIDFQGQPASPLNLDGQPDAFTADPLTYACAGCDPIRNLANIVTARVFLLARNLDPTPHYTDTKTYTLGLRTGDTSQLEVTPGGAYKRHAYSGLVRIVNVSQRRERPI